MWPCEPLPSAETYSTTICILITVHKCKLQGLCFHCLPQLKVVTGMIYLVALPQCLLQRSPLSLDSSYDMEKEVNALDKAGSGLLCRRHVPEWMVSLCKLFQHSLNNGLHPPSHVGKLLGKVQSNLTNNLPSLSPQKLMAGVKVVKHSQLFWNSKHSQSIENINIFQNEKDTNHLYTFRQWKLYLN